MLFIAGLQIDDPGRSEASERGFRSVSNKAFLSQNIHGYILPTYNILKIQMIKATSDNKHYVNF